MSAYLVNLNLKSTAENRVVHFACICSTRLFPHCRIQIQAKHLRIGRVVAIAIVRERIFDTVVHPNDNKCVFGATTNFLSGLVRFDVHACRVPYVVVRILQHGDQQRQRQED